MLKRINDYLFEVDQDTNVFFYNNRFAITFYDDANTLYYREHYHISEVLKANILVGGIGADVSSKLSEDNKKIITIA